MTENKLNLSPTHERLIIAVVLGIFPVLGMAVDLIAPSLPAISHDLHISNTISKNLISIYLLGYALGCFFIGFLSDALGRRKLAIGGFLIFIGASLLPALFPSVAALLIGRLLQGLSLGTVILMRVALSDILPPEKLVRVATLIATMWGIGPIVGPVIGGYLQYYIGWQACFYFFALYGLTGLIAVLSIIPETHFNRQPLNIRQIKTNLVTILRDPLFVGVITLMGIAYSSLIVFNTLGPFLIQNQLGHTAVYFGHVALWMGCVFLLGTITCRRLVSHYTPEIILRYAILIFLGVGIIWLMFATFASYNIWIIIIPSLFTFFGCGIIYPAGMGKGLALFRHLAGSSSAIMNLVNVLITSFTALIMSFITASSALPLAWIYLGLMTLSGLVYMFLIAKK